MALGDRGGGGGGGGVAMYRLAGGPGARLPDSGKFRYFSQN